MRSRLGCTLCRERKVKCDETKPVCGQCAKGRRHCLYTTDAIFRFIDFEAEDAESIAEHQSWVTVPDELTFITIDDPYDCATPTDDQYLLQNEDLIEDRNIRSSASHISTTSLSSIREADDTTDHIALRSTPAPEALDSIRLTPGLTVQAEESIRAVYLLDHFRKGPGLWMDMYDSSAYFTNDIPLLVPRRPLLKASVCALAAKHLHNVSVSSPSRAVGLRHMPKSDWLYEAFRLYQRALNLLKHAIAEFPSDRTASNKEELFAAVAILCMYELMDTPGTAWAAHLKALPLFVFNDEATATALSPIAIPKESIKSSIFWNLARQDLLYAFISETQTWLETDGINRLQAENGDFCSSAFESVSFSLVSPGSHFLTNNVSEDAKSNELCLLLGKISNYLTSGDGLTPAEFSLPRGQRPFLGVTQEKLLERWHVLARELNQWYDGLPATFRECARTSYPATDGSPYVACAQGFDQIWYDLPICASTMQGYHMARILLLVNQPHDSTAIHSTVSARLQSYKHIQERSYYHAKEICGITLAHPPDPVKVQSVQPLFVSGQVFSKEQERKLVLQLLREIDSEIGWRTSYHTARLEAEWAATRAERYVSPPR